MKIFFKFIKGVGLGFFSYSFLLLDAYMLAKKNGNELVTNLSEWTFGHTLGWSDYFTTFPTTSEEGEVYSEGNSETSKRFTVAEYRKAMSEVFVYQPRILEAATARMAEFGLVEGEYLAVFVRRGDKFLGESAYIESQYYAQRLLAKMGNKKALFVQTDDFRVYEELHHIFTMINSRYDEKDKIRILTTCPSTKLGFFYSKTDVSQGRSIQHMMPDGSSVIDTRHLQYLKATPQQKPITEYTADEMREHVEEFLIGIIICQRAAYVCLDHMSNVSRFIAYSHPRGHEAILAIEDMNLNIPRYDYTEETYITNPRYHSIYNGYI